MDELVKRRLVGAALLTGLAVLIVPYFFEDKTPPSALDLPLPMDSAPSEATVTGTQAPVEPMEPSRSEPPPVAPTPVKSKKYGTVPLDEAQAPPPTPSAQIPAPAPVAPASVAPAPTITPPARLPPPVAPASLAPKLQKPQVSASPKKPAEPALVPKPAVKKAESLKPAKPVSAPPSTEVAAKKTAPAPVSPQKAASAGAPASTAAKAGSNAAYLVQVGTFSDESNAKSLVEKLRKRNLPVRIQAIDGTQGGKVYRVTVGPNLDHGRAEQIQKQLAEQDGVRALILQTR